MYASWTKKSTFFWDSFSIYDDTHGSNNAKHRPLRTPPEQWELPALAWGCSRLRGTCVNPLLISQPFQGNATCIDGRALPRGWEVGREGLPSVGHVQYISGVQWFSAKKPWHVVLRMATLSAFSGRKLHERQRSRDVQAAGVPWICDRANRERQSAWGWV